MLVPDLKHRERPAAYKTATTDQNGRFHIKEYRARRLQVVWLGRIESGAVAAAFVNGDGVPALLKES